MREPYGEGPASHPDPKPCVRNPRGTGRSVGRGTREAGIELRNHVLREVRAQSVQRDEGNIARVAVVARPEAAPAQSETRCARGNSGNGTASPRVRLQKQAGCQRSQVVMVACYGTGSRTGVWYQRSDRTKGVRIPWRRLWREDAWPRRTCCGRPWPGFNTGGPR